MSSKITLEKLEQSIYRFNEMYQKYKNIDNIDDIVIKQSIKESLIQRFEYVVETSWKSIKRYLEEYKGIVSENSPKKVIRDAANLDILDGDNWILFIDLRIKTSHDYSGEKSDDVLRYMSIFYTETNKILDFLQKENRE